MKVAKGSVNAPPVSSRRAAAGALVVSAVTLVALVVLTAGDLLYGLASLLAGALGITALRIGVTNHPFRRMAGAGAALFVGGAVACLVVADSGAVSIAIVIVGILMSAVLGALALRFEIHQALAGRWHRVPAVATRCHHHQPAGW